MAAWSQTGAPPGVTKPDTPSQSASSLAGFDAARAVLVDSQEFVAWFAPVLEWQNCADSDDMDEAAFKAACVNDYTMDEACAVLRAFLAGGLDCDVPAILKAVGFRR